MFGIEIHCWSIRKNEGQTALYNSVIVVRIHVKWSDCCVSEWVSWV